MNSFIFKIKKLINKKHHQNNFKTKQSKETIHGHENETLKNGNENEIENEIENEFENEIDEWTNETLENGNDDLKVQKQTKKMQEIYKRKAVQLLNENEVIDRMRADNRHTLVNDIVNDVIADDADYVLDDALDYVLDDVLDDIDVDYLKDANDAIAIDAAEYQRYKIVDEDDAVESSLKYHLYEKDGRLICYLEL